MIELRVESLAELDVAARAVAASLEPGDVIELHGHIGAGKTTFTGHLAKALGIREPVRSPTYTVAQLYLHADGLRSLAHLDCYRDGGAGLDVEAFADLEPVLDAATWTCIEWPDSLDSWLQGRARWHVTMEAVSESMRTMRMRAPSDERELALLREPAFSGLVRRDP